MIVLTVLLMLQAPVVVPAVELPQADGSCLHGGSPMCAVPVAATSGLPQGCTWDEANERYNCATPPAVQAIIPQTAAVKKQGYFKTLMKALVGRKK